MVWLCLRLAQLLFSPPRVFALPASLHLCVLSFLSPLFPLTLSSQAKWLSAPHPSRLRPHSLVER